MTCFFIGHRDAGENIFPAISRANRYMIGLIAYAKSVGNARDLVEIARRKKIAVTNLGENL